MSVNIQIPTTLTGDIPLVASVDNNLADPNTGNAKSVLPYKSYVFQFKQLGTDAPIVIPMNQNDNNYLGDLVWTRLAPGRYFGTLDNAFPDVNKVFIPGFGDWNDLGNPYMPILSYTGTPEATFGYYTIFRTNADQVSIQVTDSVGLGVDLGTLLGDTFIQLPEVRVYS